MTIPAGWRERPLTDLADYINGAAFGPDDWGRDGLRIIRIEQLRHPDAPADYYSGPVSNGNRVDNGDLIFSWSASLFLRIWVNGPAVLNQHLFKVVEKEGVDRRFLQYLIEYNLEEIGKAAHGSTMTHITRKELDRFFAEVPDNQRVQSAIAAVLSTIDKAITQTEALIAKQQRIKTALMQDLLTRGIDEHGNLRSEETHAFKDSPLGRIPVEWEVESIGQLISIPPRNGFSPIESPSWQGAYLLTLGCIATSGFVPCPLKFAPTLDSGQEQFLLEDGDFLVTRSNTLALVGLGARYVDIGEPCIYPDLLMRLRFKSTVNTAFVEHAFRGHDARLQVQNAAVGTSGSMVKINGRSVQQIELRMPPPSEQTAIVDALERHSRAEILQREALSKLRRQKAALMQDLLTGKVPVTSLLEAEATTP